MTFTDVWRLVLAAVLVVLAALFAGADTALSRVSLTRVQQYVAERRRGAASLQKVVADPARYVNVLLFLRVLCELGATVLVTIVMADALGVGWRAIGLSVLVMTVVSYVIVGVAPRTLGLQRAGRIALRSAGTAVVLARVLSPLTRLLILLGNAVTPGRGYREGPFASEAELRDLVALAEKHQVIEAGQSQMIRSVFDLGDTIVREVMVPRTDIVVVERGRTIRQSLSLALRSGFSRIPVIGENTDDVLGIVYLKDLALRSFEHRAGESSETVERVMRPATFVPDSKPVDELLQEMQAQRIHIAMVVDEYGGTAGLVTIEDILEEIVGEITDEYDSEAPPVDRLPDGTLRVSARLHVDDLAEATGIVLDPDDIEDVDTVGGLIAKRLGTVPIPGARAEVDGWLLVAEGAAGRRNRIGSFHLSRSPGPDPGPEPGSPG